MGSRHSLARRVPRALLGFRGRAFAFAGMLAAVAVDVPRVHGAAAFFLGPCGPAVLALVLVLLASFAEESRGLARIRLSIRLRLGALAALAGSIAWALAVHVPANLASGAAVAALAVVFLAPSVFHDLATLGDPRRGESTWFERFGSDALELATTRGALPVRYDSILRLGIGEGNDEHGVLVTVRDRAALTDPAPLRWVESTREGDRFFLTERQLGADAGDFTARLQVARGAGGYR